MKSGNFNFLEPSGPLQACNGIALPFNRWRGELDEGSSNVIGVYRRCRQFVLQKFTAEWEKDGADSSAICRAKSLLIMFQR